MINKITIYDTDCLSAFVGIDRTDILRELFNQIIIPEQVYREFDRPHIQNLKLKVDELIKNKFIIKEDIEPGSEEYDIFVGFTNGYRSDKDLGKGESAAISLAMKYNGIIASNNLKDVKSVVKEYNLHHITSSDILYLAFKFEIIAIDELEEIWIKMLNNGILIPKSFLDYTEKLDQEKEEWLFTLFEK